MPDAYTLALTWLAARELSTAQLRARLTRRKFDPSEIDSTVERLTHGGYLDDRRVARATARAEATVRQRGRLRVRQRVRSMGISGEVADAAVDEVFADVDEDRLLEAAINRRLKGQDLRSLDRRGTARLVRGLLAQGFPTAAILARLRAKGANDPEE